MSERHWNISTLGNGTLVINLVSMEPPHVVNILVSPTLPAADIARVLEHCENAMSMHELKVQQEAQTVVHLTALESGPRMRGVLSGSLTVTAADGTDITQPPSEQPSAVDFPQGDVTVTAVDHERGIITLRATPKDEGPTAA